jgi:AraC-like DNA-binding protein
MEDLSMQNQAVPLARYSSLRTDDLDEAQEWVGRRLRPHHLRLSGDARSVHVVHTVADLGTTGFHYIDYGADVDVRVEAMDFLLVQIPVTGRSLIRGGNQELVMTPDRAAVTTSTDAFLMRYAAPNPRLLVKIELPVLESRLTLMLGGGPRKAVRFDLGMDLTTDAGRSWRAMVDLVFDDLDRGNALSSSPLAAKSLEMAIVDGLLAAHRHSFSRHLLDTGSPARPRTLQKAMTLIEQHCAEPLTTADIAEAVGVSARSLQDGFQTHLGTTPMAYMRSRRIQHVHDELNAADPASTSVTEVALRWGVTHTGRFAQEYRAQFGETPSHTLRFGS